VPVDVLLRALEEREPALVEHLHAVTRLSLTVGERLGLGNDELAELAKAAELADVGKVAIPDTVLHKTEPLDESEWALIRNHPVLGEEMIELIPDLSRVARVVRSTHERWDGHGYPDGLRGQAIPICARIIAVCDAFLAMTAPRAYRPALGEQEAISEILDGAGRQFDPEVAAAVYDAVLAGEHLSPPGRAVAV
jgi:HD-GYP domain-containing protein (c-di-GMP phosphodiesterase class II)